MNVLEFLIKCPNCHTETRFVAEEANPVIVHCHGCSKSIVIHNNQLYTVSEDCVKKLLNQYRPKACGKILAAKISEDAQDLINGEKIQELRKLLDKPMDVKDFIQELK